MIPERYSFYEFGRVKIDDIIRGRRVDWIVANNVQIFCSNIFVRDFLSGPPERQKFVLEFKKTTSPAEAPPSALVFHSHQYIEFRWDSNILHITTG